MTTFKKGDRVKLNRTWGRIAKMHGMDHFFAGLGGIVQGQDDLVGDIISVKLNGIPNFKSFHTDYLSKIRKKAA